MCNSSGHVRRQAFRSDLHGGFMFDYYQFPLYAFSDDKTLPLIGFHLFKPQWTPAVAKSFPGSAAGDKTRPG